MTGNCGGGGGGGTVGLVTTGRVVADGARVAVDVAATVGLA